MTGLRFSLTVAVVLWAAPTAAQESPLDERARRHFESGSSYYDSGNYARALEEFETAFELSSRPALLYNLYIAHERLGHLEEAHSHLERYLREEDIPDDRRVILEQRLANLQARMTTSESEPEPTPQPEPEPNPAPAPAAPAAAPAEEESSTTIGTAPLFAFIAAGAGLVMAGVFGMMALVEDGGLECSPACSEDDVSNLRTYNVIADVSLGVGVLGAVLGAVLLATSGDEEPSPSAWLTPDGAGLLVRGAL